MAPRPGEKVFEKKIDGLTLNCSLCLNKNVWVRDGKFRSSSVALLDGDQYSISGSGRFALHAPLKTEWSLTDSTKLRPLQAPRVHWTRKELATLQKPNVHRRNHKNPPMIRMWAKSIQFKHLRRIYFTSVSVYPTIYILFFKYLFRSSFVTNRCTYFSFLPSMLHDQVTSSSEFDYTTNTWRVILELYILVKNVEMLEEYDIAKNCVVRQKRAQRKFYKGIDACKPV